MSTQDDDIVLCTILAHLKNAVRAEEGLPLSRLQGILSQLPPSVRGRFGATTETIRLVARLYPDTIVVGPDNRVYTSTQPRASAKNSAAKSRNPADEKRPDTTDAPIELCNVTGTVSKLLMLYGFVDLVHPLRASVFFDKRFFEKNRHYDLTKSGLKLGDVVILDAVKSPPGHRAKYQATRIELLRKMASTSSPAPNQAVCQPGSVSMTNRFPGKIQAVNPSHGFILFGEDNKECAYFSIDNIDKSLLQPEKSLNDLFSVGDNVLFDAQPNPKPTSYAKWWGTNVNKVQSAELSHANDSGDEAFLSDNDIAELLLDQKEFSARRKLSGIQGSFFPNSKITGLVSVVQPNVMVLVPDTVAYCNGRKIKSFGEMLKDSAVSEDLDVFVDAVEVERDTWVATLMWTGERPKHPPVEQSESAFHNALAVAMSEMPAGTRDLEAGDLGIFSTPPKFCSAADVDHSVVVYPHSKGILKAVNDHSAVCEVQEPEGCRNVEFFTFHRNNVPHVGHFKNILRENDVVQIDYMVGTVGGREEVCCRLVWQGERPSVHQTSPSEFGLLLKARAAQQNIPAALSKLSALAEPQSHGDRCGGPSSPAPGPSCSKWPSSALHGRKPVDKQNVTSPSLPSGSATGNAATNGTSTAAGPPLEPTVYVFSGRKGTVMEVSDCSAKVEAREGQTIREVAVNVDCFYRDGRTVMCKLNQVLHKGDIVNIDYMVGRMGCKDRVHCNLAWQGRKPQGVVCLSPDEFKDKLSPRGSGNPFISDLQSISSKMEQPGKDAPSGLAKYSLSQADARPQMEVHQPPPQTSKAGSGNLSHVSIPSTGETNARHWKFIEKVCDRINGIVATIIQTTLHDEVTEVIQDLLNSRQAMNKGHSAQISQGEGDGGPVAEPSARQSSLVPGPAGSPTWQPSNASQQPSVGTGPSQASQATWGDTVGQLGGKPPSSFNIGLASAVPKMQQVMVNPTWQPSNVLQQPSVASSQASQTSWGTAVGQLGRQPLSSFVSLPSTLPNILPMTAGSIWQLSNSSQQPSIAASPCSQASKTSWGTAIGTLGGKPLPSANSSLDSVLSEVQPATGICTWQALNALQQPSVAAGAFAQASQTSSGEAMGQLGGQPPSSFNISVATAVPKAQPVTASSIWQPSNALQQPSIAGGPLSQVSQMSWDPSLVQLRGQPLSHLSISPASVPPEVLPATMGPVDGACPPFGMQQDASMRPRDKSDSRCFQNLGISFDTPAAVEGVPLDVGAWRLGSSSMQQEGGPSASSSSDCKPQVRFPEVHSASVGGLLEEPD
ncbi:uncharacterized protein [Dermacentor andersoni]|uniref:uncharacterized protein isoform X2 n=1 Tax=Dermacentor andersoni TaxID=34620 RepID=UPI002415D521|nr:uncharacterized protein LOC126527500 isoform X2 [Dermacentor andersoni]